MVTPRKKPPAPPKPEVLPEVLPELRALGLRFRAPNPPDWRWTLVQRAMGGLRDPDDVFIRRVCHVLRGTLRDEDIEEALYIHNVPFERNTLIAFIVCGASFSQIVQALGVKESVAHVFEKLFLDRSTFKNKMEWRMYVKYYIQNCGSKELATQIEAGMVHGPLVLVDRWTMGQDAPLELPARDMISKWAMTSYSKAMVARSAPITSQAAKEAFKWGAMAVKSIAEWQAIATAEATDAPNALVAIEQRKASFTPDEVGINVDTIEH